MESLNQSSVLEKEGILLSFLSLINVTSADGRLFMLKVSWFYTGQTREFQDC